MLRFPVVPLYLWGLNIPQYQSSSSACMCGQLIDSRLKQSIHRFTFKATSCSSPASTCFILSRHIPRRAVSSNPVTPFQPLDSPSDSVQPERDGIGRALAFRLRSLAYVMMEGLRGDVTGSGVGLPRTYSLSCSVASPVPWASDVGIVALQGEALHRPQIRSVEEPRKTPSWEDSASLHRPPALLGSGVPNPGRQPTR